jgi:RNase P/RNase MRP subunit POP5
MVRLKHRYIVGQVLFDRAAKGADEIAGKDLLAAVRDKISQFYGEIGTAQLSSSLAVKFHDAETNKGDENGGSGATHVFVLRCSREAEESVRFAMSTVSTVRKTTLIMRSLAVSGSSRTCISTTANLLDRAVDADWTMGEVEKKDKKARLRQVLTNSLE